MQSDVEMSPRNNKSIDADEEEDYFREIEEEDIGDLETEKESQEFESF